MGSFSNQLRWKLSEVTPGVGDYDLTRFKKLDKVSETQFTANPPDFKMRNSKNNSRSASRVRKSMPQSLDVDIKPENFYT